LKRSNSASFTSKYTGATSDFEIPTGDWRGASGDTAIVAVAILGCRIGDAIRLYRSKANLTREKLAELVDLNPKYIGEVERGEKLFPSRLCCASRRQ
jgi:DNA-binding XRE family transcriptional regulator